MECIACFSKFGWTYLLDVCTKADQKSVAQTFSLTLSGSAIPFYHKVRNLRVYFDGNLTMDSMSTFCTDLSSYNCVE